MAKRLLLESRAATGGDSIRGQLCLRHCSRCNAGCIMQPPLRAPSAKRSPAKGTEFRFCSVCSVSIAIIILFGCICSTFTPIQWQTHSCPSRQFYFISLCQLSSRHSSPSTRPYPPWHQLIRHPSLNRASMRTEFLSSVKLLAPTVLRSRSYSKTLMNLMK